MPATVTTRARRCARRACSASTRASGARWTACSTVASPSPPSSWRPARCYGFLRGFVGGRGDLG
eukprot:3484186-Lingulodinium_polyedra.AAC.1